MGKCESLSLPNWPETSVTSKIYVSLTSPPLLVSDTFSLALKVKADVRATRSGVA